MCRKNIIYASMYINIHGIELVKTEHMNARSLINYVLVRKNILRWVLMKVLRGLSGKLII